MIRRVEVSDTLTIFYEEYGTKTFVIIIPARTLEARRKPCAPKRISQIQVDAHRGPFAEDGSLRRGPSLLAR